MLRLPNRKEREPPSWVSSQLDAFGDCYLEMQQGFQPFCKIFSLGLPPIVFQNNTDNTGLIITLWIQREIVVSTSAEFVQRLGQRVLLFRGRQTTNDSPWRHRVAGFELTDGPAVANGVEKYLHGADSGTVVNRDISISGTTAYELNLKNKEVF